MAQFWELLLETIGNIMRGAADRIRLMLDPTFWKVRIYDRIRRFFVWLFQVRPRDDKDYYAVLWWLVSRRLVYAVVILAGIASGFYLFWINPIINIDELGKGTAVYAYNSIPLRFANGNVRIRAKSGYVAYEGSVGDGYVTGLGTLYDENGNLVYKGNFVESQFEGDGKLYYPTGQIKYEGSFSKNLFEGTGTLFWENGVKRYDGAFSQGFMEGDGTLYNAAESRIFQGTFHHDELIYAQLLGKTAEQLAMMYAGTDITYQADTKSAVVMEEIDAVYCSDTSGDNIDGMLKADSVCVCKDYICYGGRRLGTLEEVKAAMGEASYEGNSYATYLDVVGIDYVNRNQKETGIDVVLETEQMFDRYWQVGSYTKDVLVYLHVFQRDDITYTFISKDRNGNFFMYQIE